MIIYCFGLLVTPNFILRIRIPHPLLSPAPMRAGDDSCLQGYKSLFV